MPSKFRTRDVCQMAFERTKASFLDAVAKGEVKRPHGALVFVDPTEKHIPMGNRQLEFADYIRRAVEFVGFIGDPEDFEFPFHKIALGKGFISWITGLPSRRVQNEYVYLLVDGDTVYGGSDIDEGGAIAAFSGVESVQDEGFAAEGNRHAKGEAQRRGDVYQTTHEDDNFYGGEQFPAPKGYNLDNYHGRYEDGDYRCPVCDWRQAKYVAEKSHPGQESYLRCQNPACGYSGIFSEFNIPD